MSAALAKLSEAKLRAWLLARMRGEQEDPPVDESRMESPDDYVKVVHRQTGDAKFRARLEKAAVGALREAAAGDLSGGVDARAARNLAALADGLELSAAEPVLREIAQRGALGGHDGALDPDAEELVLFALAGVQKPETLFGAWLAVWNREVPRLWPVVTAGLRLSDAKRALAILPRAAERGARHADFPLGEVLWAFATDERYAATDIAGALAGLSREQRARCRRALEELGAEPAELNAWLAGLPARPFWERPGLRIPCPPRFVEIAASC